MKSKKQKLHNTKSCNEPASSIETSKFKCPEWAGKADAGVHVDVIKDGAVKSKVMIDTKKCYFFGRNIDICDFHANHSSCSRIHAVLVWHSAIKKVFIMDLGSSHGTFIGRTRIEPNVYRVVEFDVTFSLGASTRKYILHTKPKEANLEHSMNESLNSNIDLFVKTLPQNTQELDNLTEFNTTRNRRIMKISMMEEKKVSKNKNVSFSDMDDIINPEDVDPSIGKFQNLVTTTIVQKRKSGSYGNNSYHPQVGSVNLLHKSPFKIQRVSGDIDATEMHLDNSFTDTKLPNLAPQLLDKCFQDPVVVDNYDITKKISRFDNDKDTVYEKHCKKRYAKETWPGRKTNNLI